MISIQEYRTAEGKPDWAAWRAAQIAAGERCRLCEAALYDTSAGQPRCCEPCKTLTEHGGHVVHERLVRCPNCGQSWKPGLLNLHESLLQTTKCPICSQLFIFIVNVHYSFCSPARTDYQPPWRNGQEQQAADRELGTAEHRSEVPSSGEPLL